MLTVKYKIQVSRLIDVSRKVIGDCCMANGAMVAASSTQPYYPEGAKNYKFVWPRDGSYICMAANLLKMDIDTAFFYWCSKAEGWTQTGLFYEKYYINGRKAATNFQPDQTGSFLYILCNNYLTKGYRTDIAKKLGSMIKKTANGLCKMWNGKCFTMISQDLWEERYCFPDLEENFTYSLAACIAGLQRAHDIFPNGEWLKVADQMKQLVLKNNRDYFIRSFGKHRDERVDASLLGLAWPFQLVPYDSQVMINTMNKMEEAIIKDHGVYRYEQDEYDGWMFQKNIHRRKGAGYWPLLNFWMSICYMGSGEREKAEHFYTKVLNDLEGDFIPEQVFNNRYQVAVSPLAWGHAMFVIASHKLGLFEGA